MPKAAGREISSKTSSSARKQIQLFWMRSRWCKRRALSDVFTFHPISSISIDHFRRKLRWLRIKSIERTKCEVADQNLLRFYVSPRPWNKLFHNTGRCLPTTTKQMHEIVKNQKRLKNIYKGLYQVDITNLLRPLNVVINDSYVQIL